MKHKLEIKYAGEILDNADKALIMLHGRGATAEDILSLSEYLNVDGYVLLAPQATNYTWYPYSFMANAEENEPWLSSAIDIVKETVNLVLQSRIKAENIYFLGFSQGACLAAEYTARNAQKYGGIALSTGGLIGKEINKNNYIGDFNHTPIFFGTSDPDPHVPVDRVRESAKIAREMNADVTKKIYPNRGHSVSEDEINQVNNLIFKL